MKPTLSIITGLLLTSGFVYSQNDNVSEEDIMRSREKAKQYYHLLTENKKLFESSTARSQAGHILFGWPMRANGNYDDVPGYYLLQNNVDDDTGFPVYDYNCEHRSYDGHNGTDISIWPFWWHLMNNNYVQAVAAAPGVVVAVVDSINNDYNCDCVGPGNHITILHSDSTFSIYYHIRSNSATVNEGDIVSQGQALANIASSGCSSNPHLHFEVRDKDGEVIDPYVGSNPSTDCNDRNEESYWQNQKPYREPRINRVMTHHAQPSMNFCPDEEHMNARTNFNPGNVVWLGIAVHDYLVGTSISYTVDYPDGSFFFAGNHVNANQTLSGDYRVFTFVLPTNAPAGTYQVRATYQGVTYAHYFTVNCIPNYAVTGILTGSKGYIASNVITSTAALANGSNVRMQAANTITLTPGFTAVAGSTFKARIRDCNFSE